MRLSGVAFGVLLAATTFGQDRLNADIPFAFHLGPVHMSAGAYRVSVVDRVARAWIIRAEAGKPRVVFIAPISVEAKQAASTGVLVFRRYGNRYFLSRMRIAGDTLGWQLVPSKAEREFVKTRRPVEAASVILTKERPR